MDRPSEVSACKSCGAQQTEDAVLRCATMKEEEPLCTACLDKIVAMRTAAQQAGFHIGL